MFSLIEQERKVKLETPTVQPLPPIPVYQVPSLVCSAAINTKGPPAAASSVLGLSGCSSSHRTEDTNAVKRYLEDLIKLTQVRAL